MTEVDTVMLEGTAPPAPVPVSSPTQITTTAVAATESSPPPPPPPSMNENSGSDTVAAASASHNNNDESGQMTENNVMKTTTTEIKAAAATSSTTPTSESSTKSTEIAKIPTTTTASSNGGGTSSSSSSSNLFISNEEKDHNDTDKQQQQQQQQQQSTPMDVDDDDNCGRSGGTKVTTTTTEPECEENSQVTSCSSAALIAKHNGDNDDDDDDETRKKTQKECGEANLTPPPEPSEDAADATAAAHNSKSQTAVDGNDLVEGGGAGGDAGETENRVDTTKTELKSSSESEIAAARSSLKTTDVVAKRNENSQNCASAEKDDGKDTISSQVDDDDNADADADADEQSVSSNQNRTEKQVNKSADNKSCSMSVDASDASAIAVAPTTAAAATAAAATIASTEMNALSESHLLSMSTSTSPSTNVSKKVAAAAAAAAKDSRNASPAESVERMDVDQEEMDPLSIMDDNELSPSIIDTNNKNGLLTTNATNNNGAVVNLDDDSDDDDENCDDDGRNVNANAESSSRSIIKGKPKSNGRQATATKSINCSDSDGAVVIGSDSENESSTTTTTTTTSRNAKQQQQQQNKAPLPRATPVHESDEDDDDDCVVIEDDSPAEMTSHKPIDVQARRKSVVLDSENNSDDSQPPSKRQRRGGIAAAAAAASGGLSQLTIKDARTLLPAELHQTSPLNAANAVKKSLPPLNESGGGGGGGGGGIYPINITPAGGNILTTAASGGAKLASISASMGVGASGGSAATTVGSPIPAVLSGINANANLLPGLTDDMFVLEAPSFIVPYIYEKPPTDSLKDIVKEIESKYELSKDDLTEADKSDEFDMITEQNKEDRDSEVQANEAAAAASKKKKRRRFNPDVDDSWSEESDEDDDDDDDDDSESGVRTKVLIKEVTDDLTALKGAIKPAAVVTQSLTPNPANSSAPGQAKPGQENYFESPLGKFFMDIGVGLVQEFVQTDLIRLQKRKMRKSLGKNMGDFERAISALSGNLEASKKKNSPFKFTMKRCEFCNFKSESALAMANHYETPHMNGPLYKCNFCTFEIRNATEIVYHMEAMHNIKARLIKPLPYHQCPNCGFEDNGRAKLARHQPVCAKKFRPEFNLAPPNDWEAPAKIPRIKPRHGLVGTATAYQAMAAQAAAQKAALATIQQQQQQQQQARNLQAAALAAQNAVNKIRGRPPVGLSKVAIGAGPNGTAAVMRGAPQAGPRPMATNVVLPNNYQLPGNQIIPTTNAMHAAKKTALPGQPSISITPLPRQNASPQTASPSTSKMPQAGLKPGRSPQAVGNKAQFVICEICDGYIKDLEQLRNHMQWMHEVKIHPKMIYNRPPLNCQKCQFRFFTDQGLERHLLGSHGLVTSSMQEAANKGKDAGRCPVCGRMYQWKLLNHVARDHHMTLKPAHLSYKCTVCTATFGMYKQFETHVYTAHSTVAKKAMDNKKNNAASSSGGINASSSGSQAASSSSSSSSAAQRGASGGLSATTAANNDALLKPLKINDEITIIPQPASKPRITNMESHVID